MGAYYFAYFTSGWKIGEPMADSGYVYMFATTMTLCGIVAVQVEIYFAAVQIESLSLKLGFLQINL